MSNNHDDEFSELNQLAEDFINESNEKLNDGKLKQAEEALLRARDICEKISNKRLLSKALNLLSIVYSEMGNSSLDMDCLLDAYETANEADYYDYAAKCLNNIGSKYMSTKAYDRALDFFVRAEELLNKAFESGQADPTDNQSFMLIMSLNLATIYSTRDLKLARKYYEMAKEQIKHPDNVDLRFTFQAFEGLLLWRIGDHDEAMTKVDPIIEVASQTEYAQDYLELMSYVLDLLKEMKDFERWEKVLRIMDTRITEDAGLNFRIELHKHWLDFYETSGDDESYKMACVKFYHLYQEKAAETYKLDADTIDLKIKMRKTARQKEAADAIIYVDSLTTIGNRNRMQNDSKAYIEESIKSHTCITVGLIDIDYFKECNDTYGHIKGDECLKKVAKVLADEVGPNGNVYRYGGDEFLILIPGISASDILTIGKNIKRRINELQIPNIKSPISSYVTLSQGYTQAYAEEGDTIDTLVNLADQVLYSVKRCGRNNYKYTHINDIIGGAF